MNIKFKPEISDEEFAILEKEQEGLRSCALGFLQVHQKKPHNHNNKKPGKGVHTGRMRTIKIKSSPKKLKIWQDYLDGKITITELKEKM
jgi:hypothetical protein